MTFRDQFMNCSHTVYQNVYETWSNSHIKNKFEIKLLHYISIGLSDFWKFLKHQNFKEAFVWNLP